ncbi:hypothetical protein UJ101_01756 [Flavobacteriaceae bacterium UJ101]|nr:hypothetical protein UJ101_01756 [Flavobacteriaceae bacterium UJ101]
MKVVILGAGNVASHLTRALLDSTVQVAQIYNRTLEKAEAIAKPYNLAYTDKISELQKADLYIISTSDDAVEEVSYHIPFENALVVHTAGSLGIDSLKGRYRKGVLYPLQTLSIDKGIRYEKVPFFIEAEKDEDFKELEKLMLKVSEKVHRITAEQRAKLHLSAVFVCNFVNYMYSIGDKLVQEAGLPFETLIPLIDETCQKIHEMTPLEAQTGPAKRNDQLIIDKHLEMLKDHNDLARLYTVMTKGILKQQDEL